MQLVALRHLRSSRLPFAAEPRNARDDHRSRLGVAWQFAPNGQLVLGYKLDQWWNVRSSFSFVGLDRKEDILIQTPFVKATFRF